MMKKLMLAASIAAIAAASVGTMVTPAAAAVQVYVQTAPPPLREERVPAARHGYTWAPGHWQAHGQKYAWNAGSWQRNRPGYTYNQPNWVEHDGRWSMEKGHWARMDNDHDGVPNGRDTQPNNPNRN
jgi:hypothetical protein